jgi:hypothetical protein
MVIIDYDNGVRASFTLNMFCQELYEELVVVGERGRLVASEQASFHPIRPQKLSYWWKCLSIPHTGVWRLAIPTGSKQAATMAPPFLSTSL